MEDMEDMKASTEVTSMEAFMGASVSFRGSSHGRYGRYESFRGSKFHGSFHESFHESFHGSNGSFHGSYGSFHGSLGLGLGLGLGCFRGSFRESLHGRFRGSCFRGSSFR